MDEQDLRARHPRFAGDLDHLRRFAALLGSSPMTDQRGRELAEWRAFNTVQVVPSAANGAGAAAKKVASWTAYRGKRGVDLRGIDCPFAFLGTVDLGGARVDDADLSEAKLRGAHLQGASLVRANLSRALLLGADLRDADLRDARLPGADMREADLSGARLDGADLTGADLTRCALVGASIAGAHMDGCRVYGTSAWKLLGEPASSNDLVVTPPGEPVLLLDKLRLAQFMYLLLENAELRDVIDTLTSKSVLLLGRFTPERKPTLDALRQALRTVGYSPLMFDFDKPSSKTMTETVRLLAQMARFIVVDLTDPASAPYELGLLMGMNLHSTPLVPLIRCGQVPFAMFQDLAAERWVLPVVSYVDTKELIGRLQTEVVQPAEQRASGLRR
jgi:uncharacterized protein YjbI with pentapeptide repeats